MKRIGVLASGRGSNLQAIIDACASGDVNAAVTIVISNNSRAMALQRARAAGIDTAHLSSATHPEPAHLDHAITEELERHEVDLVVTAGYMKRLGPCTLRRWQGNIINTHPSLLPRHGGTGMFGINVHRAVIDSGDRKTGVTIHRVEGDYDTGPVVAQAEVDVRPDDTPESLAERVIAVEHRLLVETLAKLTADET